MSFDRRNTFFNFIGTTVLLSALPAAPLWAAEEVTASSTNLASQFLRTDSLFGTMVIWFLVLTSTAIVSLIIANFIKSRKAAFIPPTFVAKLEQLLQEKNYREAVELANSEPSPFGQIVSAALGQASRGYAAMEQALEETADNVGSQRVRSLVWLEIAGAAGPMVGLFGTVFGMIEAFSKMVELGGSPKPAELAGGIATALVCTFWGLVVGIPGVISGVLFRVKVEGLIDQAIFDGHRMMDRFRGTPASTTAQRKPPVGGAAPKPYAQGVA